MYAADCVGVQREVQLVHLRVVHWQVGVRRGLACRLVVCREWGAALDSGDRFHTMCQWDGAPTVPPPMPLPSVAGAEPPGNKQEVVLVRRGAIWLPRQYWIYRRKHRITRE